MKAWREEIGTGALHIDLKLLWQNGVVESSNGRLRATLLISETHDTLLEARYLIERWPLLYKHWRIQPAVGKVTVGAFAATCTPFSDYPDH